MDSWKEPIYRHEEKKKRPVSTDFKCVGQGKQCAWPEKLKSVMHRLNSILSHEKRIKSFGAGWKTRCVRIVCDWQRHWHTKYHSARKIISRLNHTTGCLSGAGVRHSDMTSDLSTATHKMLKTGWRENVREGSEERERGLSRLGKGEKVHKDWIIKWGWGGGRGGGRRALGASRRSIWSINVQSNGLTDWGMMGKWPFLQGSPWSDV